MSAAAKSAASAKKKVEKVGGKLRKAAEKIIHGPIMTTNIPAGTASAGPPLGTMLGQVSPILNYLTLILGF